METKQVIVIRKDLNMRKGKMCSQAAHASMKVILDIMCSYTFDTYTHLHLTLLNDTPLKDWIDGIFTKIVVGCDSEEELLDLARQAYDNELYHAKIKDVGLTEFRGESTWTALAIGPDESEKIDEITGHLKLL